MKKQTFYYSIEAECEDSDYLTFAELKRPAGYKIAMPQILEESDKFTLAMILRPMFDKSEKIDECRYIIELCDKLDIPTKQMKNDFECEFKQPYKN